LSRGDETGGFRENSCRLAPAPGVSQRGCCFLDERVAARARRINAEQADQCRLAARQN
jgi:hypothetical protein